MSFSDFLYTQNGLTRGYIPHLSKKEQIANMESNFIYICNKLNINEKFFKKNINNANKVHKAVFYITDTIIDPIDNHKSIGLLKVLKNIDGVSVPVYAFNNIYIRIKPI